ncbi:ABC transporter G family member 22 isoform X1 [Ananas comosus]|uniref:ABC transporter G family member 22 isoform X1 n=2 Tax=Ananas comosus TaxID=4615 RepID=A0A6P5G6B4_ANACO|nr:ABC transporter G family member 22 isoform X1 [Ananas comosus]XP_020103848.1 ABC transporter G family member 22 isoform X1 [Ananas comosus]XP_020103849.1 ABC transporter G family member 22 isoform X1 [Ananas comosus]
MDSAAPSGISRTRSEQLEMATATQSLSRTASAETVLSAEMNGTSLSRKSSFAKKGGVGSSPGKRGGNHHIRKSRSAQLKLDLEEVSSGAALSRASSASLGFSFSFTGFTGPPEDVGANLQGAFSDDDNAVDPEAGIARKRPIAEPTLPIYLKFTEVKYKVILKGMTSTTEKDILHGISGSASPGEVLALMGPSGCGKTTLLSILGGRINGNIIEGTITYNDEPYNKSLKRRIGFVTQDDVLFAHLTVRETLTYAALLRLPQTMSKQQKEERAMDVIYELGLERCQDTMIGGSFVRGISGGERKRVCIGNEIIINPSLLLLDEPTSGLDSTTALRIVQVLHDIAEAGKTVLTTIHQPSSRLFLKFDKLILLGKGSLLYFGKASEAMAYFQSIGCSPLIAMNPAEFLLDLANGNTNDISIPSELDDRVQTENLGSDTRNEKPTPKDVHEYLVEAYETRVANKEKKKLLAPLPISQDLKATVSSPKREWGASWWQQYSILFWRGLKERRHDYLSWMRITQVIATAFILGLLWWHSGSANPEGQQDQAGLLFFIAVFWGFFPVFTAIFTFPQERAMLKKERAVDMYKLSSYFMARTTSDLPLDLFLPVIFLLIVYFMAGLRQSIKPFFLTMLTVFLSIIAAQGLGLAIGATLMDIKKATTLASVTVMTFMLAGGFFVKGVPLFISWIRYISFNYHTYRLLLKVQYNHVPPSINVSNLDNGAKEVAALIAMIFGYRLLAYVSLRRMQL